MMTLNFTNINKFILGLFICGVLFIGVTCSNPCGYTIKHRTDDFELTIYSNSGEIIVNRIFKLEPIVSNINDNIYRCVISTGSNSSYTFFVNTKDEKISEDYFNLLFYNKTDIVFLENDTIYVTDMFDKENVKLEITRNFLQTAVPQSAIISAKIEKGFLCIEYFKNENYETICERIPLNTRGRFYCVE